MHALLLCLPQILFHCHKYWRTSLGLEAFNDPPRIVNMATLRFLFIPENWKLIVKRVRPGIYFGLVSTCY